MSKTRVFLIVILAIIIIFFMIHGIGKYIINNKGVKQMDAIDKIRFSYNYGLVYKLGVLLSRDFDTKYLFYLYKNDPIIINFHRGLKNKYGRIAVIDTMIKKFYVVLDPELAKKILKRDDVFSSGFTKELVFQNIMPKNIGVCRGLDRKIKRHFNEELFGTKKMSVIFNGLKPIENGADYKETNIKKQLNNRLHGEYSLNYKFNNAKSIIKECLKTQPLKTDDFDNLAYKIIGKLYIGDNSEESITILRSFADYVRMDSNLSPHALFNKVFTSKKERKQLLELINKQFYKNNNGNSLITHIKMYIEQFNNGVENDIINEFPHWFIPIIEVSKMMIPNLLHIILSIPDIYERVISEIDQNEYNIYSNKTFLHHCVIEHLRLYNPINITVVRRSLANTVIDGIEIKKDSEVLVLFSSILRNEKQFYNPDNFIPERWVDKSVEEQHIVFGVGEQRCPSINFTPFYYKCYIYELLKTYNYKQIKNIYKGRKVPLGISKVDLI